MDMELISLTVKEPVILIAKLKTTIKMLETELGSKQETLLRSKLPKNIFLLRLMEKLHTNCQLNLQRDTKKRLFLVLISGLLTIK